MARPSKLRRFAEMSEFSHVFEPDGQAIMREDYMMKGCWKEKFFENNQPLTLELGCGRGEYTVGLAEKFNERNFLGLDVKGARMWKGATYALKQGLRNVGFVRSRIEFIEHIFMPGEVDEIWITFPDPQPKKESTRLIHTNLLKSYQNVIRPGGYIHLKTDSRMLHEYLLFILKHNNISPEVATADLYLTHPDDEILSVKTYYEESFLAQGKPITYIRFKTPDGHIFTKTEYFNAQAWI